MARLRLSLTIPGAVSLGAYEGGALAALIIAIKALPTDTVVVDTIGAASAGSITGLLAARGLLRRVDPFTLLSDAWVNNVSFKALKTHKTASPLSADALNAMADKVLATGSLPENDPGTPQATPIRLSFALGSLAGLDYSIRGLAPNAEVAASTFLDFYGDTFDSQTTDEQFIAGAQAAIASGSNALGFPPKRLDRVRAHFTFGDGPVDAPEDGRYWYTDGGTVDNEPLGRSIDDAQAITTDDRRLFLLVHPNQAQPTTQPPPVWGGDKPQPGWLRTLTHAFSMNHAQTIFGDIQRVEQVNARLAAIEAAFPDPATQARVRGACGLGDKQRLEVEVVSPLLGPNGSVPPSEQLAGAFLFHFGGFFDIAYRQSDFVLGYRNMAEWLRTRLSTYLPGVDAGAALERVDSRLDAVPWRNVEKGGASLGSLSFRNKLSFFGLLLHTARVAVHDLRTGSA
ncbi:MAG: patatin-like phospholipase family protein [Acidimicrobiales bacterium]